MDSFWNKHKKKFTPATTVLLLVAFIGFIVCIVYATGLWNEIFPSGEHKGTNSTSVVNSTSETENSYNNVTARKWADSIPSNFELDYPKPTSNNKKYTISRKSKNPCATARCNDTVSEILKGINFATNPCDDFYEFACGNWIASRTIPPFMTEVSQYTVMQDKIERITNDILQENETETDSIALQQAKRYYSACKRQLKDIESNTADALNILNFYGKWPMVTKQIPEDDWVGLAADLQRNLSVHAFFKISIWQNTIHLTVPDFALHAVYLSESEKHSKIVQAFQSYIVDLASEVGKHYGIGVPERSYLEARAKEVIEFERSIAMGKSRDKEKESKLLKLHQFEEYFDNVTETRNLTITTSWKPFIKQIFNPSGVNLTVNDSVVLSDEAYFGKLCDLFDKTSPMVIFNYLHFRLASKIMWRISPSVRESYHKYRRLVTGVTVPDTVQRVCIEETTEHFGWAIAQTYVEKHFDRKTKAEVELMKKRMLLAFKDLLHASQWVRESNKTETYHKKANWLEYEVCVAFPPTLIDNGTYVAELYKDLDIGNESFTWMFVNAKTWSVQIKLEELRESTTFSCAWYHNPTTVNALFDSSRYNMEFPAGILQLPFYSAKRPASLNYGSIGFIIGHEITHAFETEGWTTDKDGNSTERKECLEKQYSKYNLKELGFDGFINGSKTFGENFADNGGVKEAFWAFQKHQLLHGPEPRLKGLEQFSPEQLFFIAFAQTKCSISRPESIAYYQLTGSYSPSKFRILGPIRNFPKFSDVWNCPVGSSMNPDPNEFSKCTIF